MIARLCLAIGLALAHPVFAHDCEFVVSRDAGAPPRLYMNGPSNYLGGDDCLELLPNNGPLKGSWFLDAPGISTLKRDGDVRRRFRLDSAGRQVGGGDGISA